jgi:predicted transcriptional regulator
MLNIANNSNINLANNTVNQQADTLPTKNSNIFYKGHKLEKITPLYPKNSFICSICKNSLIDSKTQQLVRLENNDGCHSSCYDKAGYDSIYRVKQVDNQAEIIAYLSKAKSNENNDGILRCVEPDCLFAIQEESYNKNTRQKQKEVTQQESGLAHKDNVSSEIKKIITDANLSFKQELASSIKNYLTKKGFSHFNEYSELEDPKITEKIIAEHLSDIELDSKYINDLFNGCPYFTETFHGEESHEIIDKKEVGLYIIDALIESIFMQYGIEIAAFIYNSVEGDITAQLKYKIGDVTACKYYIQDYINNFPLATDAIAALVAEIKTDRSDLLNKYSTS